jgi:hypothetical protein
MPQSDPKGSPTERFPDNPILWFFELMFAAERGNFDRAAEAHRELDRLGWKVRPSKTRSKRGGIR